MKFKSEKLFLNCIQTVFQGEANDVYVAEDLYVQERPRYVLLAIRDHEVTKLFWKCFFESGMSPEDVIYDSFVSGGMDIIVFPYSARRPLMDYYNGRTLELRQCEEICKNLVLQCITNKMPYPIMYLILSQNMVNLSKDNSIFFTYEMDLKALDSNITEKNCVVQCARIILELLEPKSGQKVFSYRLVRMRSEAEGYRSFAELYKDVTISAEPAKKKGPIRRIRELLAVNKDGLFAVLIFICGTLAFIALCCFIMLAIFGDIPLIRIVVNNFKRIGTESLLQ